LSGSLGPLSARNQKEMGKDLSTNNISSMINSFSKIDVSTLSDKEKAAHTEIKNALTIASERSNEKLLESGQIKTKPSADDGIFLGEGDIKSLLSGNESDKQIGLNALKAICDLSGNPNLCKLSIKGSGMLPSSQASETIDITQTQTSMIKWSRDLVAKTYFQSAAPAELSADVNKLLGTNFKVTKEKDFFNAKKGEVQVDISPDKVKNMPNINDFIANVGFNRLMSGNNMLGASLSSDVDFKLVFDDTAFKKELQNANKDEQGNITITDQEATQIAKKVQETMVETLTKAKEELFEPQFKLTLEVAKFTVKSMSTLIEEAGSVEPEKNFLATVLHNSSLMGGSSEVRDKFINLIDQNLGTVPDNWKEVLTSDNPPKNKTTLDNLNAKIANIIEKDSDSISAIKSKFSEETKAFALANGFDLSKQKDVSRLLKEGTTNLPGNSLLKDILKNNPSIATGLDSRIASFNKTGLANRNWQQNLGDSDKGSITAIKHLPEIEKIITSTVDNIMKTPKMVDTAKKTIKSMLEKEVGKEEQPITDFIKSKNIDITKPMDLKKLLTQSPIVLKEVIHTDSIDKDLLKLESVKSSINGFKMFDGKEMGNKLDMALGLAKTFTKDGERNFIDGKPSLVAKEDWMYSVKFAGCRLNDMFDMVPKETYQLSFPVAERETQGAKYDESKTVAGALNAFAVQIQNRTYEHYSAQGLGHGDMDTKYDRLKSDEFTEMIVNPDMKSKFNSMLTSMKSELDALPDSTFKTSINADIAKVGQIIDMLKPENNPESVSKETWKKTGFELFSALTSMADKGALNIEIK
ncbi:MAG: hypothetical protein ACK4IX_02015, partial [Candidatus Sericytochromatia bacterium]